MFTNSIISFNTIQAYLETHYCVHGDHPTTLKVGEANLALANLHQVNGVDSSAFITAYNPFSQVCDVATNTNRQSALAAELSQRRLSFIEGIGQHPRNQWPGEVSFLVLGLSLEATKTLGAQYHQNAVIWSGSDAVPQLILLR